MTNPLAIDRLDLERQLARSSPTAMDLAITLC
jgi:hypothetical protein